MENFSDSDDERTISDSEKTISARSSSYDAGSSDQPPHMEGFNSSEASSYRTKAFKKANQHLRNANDAVMDFEEFEKNARAFEEDLEEERAKEKRLEQKLNKLAINARKEAELLKTQAEMNFQIAELLSKKADDTEKLIGKNTTG